MTNIYPLYIKFRETFPQFTFGYATKPHGREQGRPLPAMYYSLSVSDRYRSTLTQVGLDDSTEDIKRAWYALLKELDPHVVPAKTSK